MLSKRPRSWTAGELADQVEVRVAGERRKVPRRLLDLMAGPRPPVDCESNGCGPKLSAVPCLGRLVSWLVPDVLHGWPIWIGCHWHDYHYGPHRPLGGTWASRRQADFLLARNILTVIAEAGVCSWPRAATVAGLYWLGVRLGGWCAFSYGPGEAPRSALERVRERTGLFRRAVGSVT